MKIIKTKPYFIKKINNSKEFIDVQKKLFNEGYTWLDGNKVINGDYLSFPLYLTNIEFCYSEKKNAVYKFREIYDRKNNNVLFYGVYSNEFDVKMLRRYKLEKIIKNDG